MRLSRKKRARPKAKSESAKRGAPPVTPEKIENEELLADELDSVAGGVSFGSSTLSPYDADAVIPYVGHSSLTQSRPGPLKTTKKR